MKIKTLGLIFFKKMRNVKFFKNYSSILFKYDVY